MQHLCPVDELHEIRLEIAKLQAREKALVQHFLRDTDAPKTGRYAKVEVVRERHLVFDADLMPENLRYNANFHREQEVQFVRVQPLPMSLSSRPGWPMRREPQTALH